jgi:hypothetical protein
MTNHAATPTRKPAENPARTGVLARHRALAMPRWAAASAAVVVTLALASALLTGCALAPKSGSARGATLVGNWRAADTAGQPASLSDLTLSANGQFRYGGKNALGGPVAFTGTYKTGVVEGTPWVALYYADYPDAPKLWFYRLEGDKLTVSAVRGNLTNGSALVLERQ